ncbi:hypothetical protein PR202_ga27500 [Eleusine coracana subsp. coracana]|uniref:F-box domain-containing protein n=1 Tax=Eleusine coracana subsp. coracana TaxID=191504 RepID=A0AAV5DGY0_ELECO|nr:hypothetical protein PR202_ga27500 [Eleusine coracana subsp. coracana]
MRRSPQRPHRRAGEEAAAPELDRLSALPDALLHRVMSSLKAWEVVRTCVLARRWRHLWASAPCVDLRIGGDDDAPLEFARFASRLFRRRDASAAVDMLRLRSSDEDDARSWIRAAIKRKAREIHLIGHRNGLASLEHAAFVSRHLKILKLSYAQVDDNLFKQLSSRCPSLEEMDLKDCLLSGSEISSSSLKTLTMVNCNMFWGLTISAPNLVLLRCIAPIGQAPSKKDGSHQVFGGNSGCSDSKILGGHNVLHSLSNATSLELLADAGEVVLTRELKRCPSFSNLKTLFLGEWCMDANFDALVFLLQRSPNLQRIFLELKLNFSTKRPMKSSVQPKGRSFVCKHLQMVKIKCSKDDVRVHKLAHLFKANGIPIENIFVRRTGSTCESYILSIHMFAFNFMLVFKASSALTIPFACLAVLETSNNLRGKKMMKELAKHELEFWGE